MATKACEMCREPWMFARQLVQTEDGPAHLRECGIDVSYTNVFWGGRSEIKPSEISPVAYREFCQSYGIDPTLMKD